MKVAPSQQVMLKVRFLEVDRNAGRDLGINWFGGNKNGVGQSGLGDRCGDRTGLTHYRIQRQVLSRERQRRLSRRGLGGRPVWLAAGAVSSIRTGFGIDTLISALEENGLVKTLAEPDLISQSGEKATLLCGHRSPIPTVAARATRHAWGRGQLHADGLDRISHAATLNFNPTVLNTGLINVHLDAAGLPRSIRHTAGHRQRHDDPALNSAAPTPLSNCGTARASPSPASCKCRTSTSFSQLPWFGNVPVLGALFRSTNYQKAETDLVVIVTVHLVRPVAPGKHLATPFDNTLPANDVDLFLMGQAERKKKYTEFVTSGGGLQGPTATSWTPMMTCDLSTTPATVERRFIRSSPHRRPSLQVALPGCASTRRSTPPSPTIHSAASWWPHPEATLRRRDGASDGDALAAILQRHQHPRGRRADGQCRQAL